MRTAMSGSGMPTEASLFGPFTGFTQSAIIASVREYPSMMRAPVSASKRVLVSASSGDAPHEQTRIDVKSTFPRCTSGWFSSAIYSVGTPLKNVGFTRLTVASKSARSRGFGTIASAAPAMNVSDCTPTLP